MSRSRDTHLFERAVEWMAAQGAAQGAPAEAVLAAPGLAAAPPGHAATPAASAASKSPPPAIALTTLEVAGLVTGAAQRSRMAEEWRVAAGHLLRSLRAARQGALQQETARQAPGNIIMVTSARPNEGKSFSALNLCGRLSQDRMAEVILIDLDSKSGALSDLLALSDRPGLFDLVADPAARAADMILPTAVPGLSFLPVGRRPADGAATSGRTITRPAVAAIEALARQFSGRVLVLDTPPCLATSDASSLAPAVTQIALVVEAERTQRHDVEAALELLRPCHDITLVLNKMRQGSARAFGEYEYYYG